MTTADQDGTANDDRRSGGGRTEVRKWPVVGVMLAGLWVFVRGVALDPAAIAGEFLIGLGVGFVVAFGFRRLYQPTVDLGRNLRAVPTATLYVLLFAKEVAVANLDVAFRVLHPRLPIEPDVVELPLRVQGDAAITTIANSITLTPGTLTMDHDPDTNTLYVHGIVGLRREAVVEPIRRWEDILLLVFDEELSPGDPVPRPEKPADEPAPADEQAVDADGGPTTATEHRTGSDPDRGGGDDDS